MPALETLAELSRQRLRCGFLETGRHLRCAVQPSAHGSPDAFLEHQEHVGSRRKHIPPPRLLARLRRQGPGALSGNSNLMSVLKANARRAKETAAHWRAGEVLSCCSPHPSAFRSVPPQTKEGRSGEWRA